MLSSISGFPTSELLSDIRNNRNAAQDYLPQIQNLNINWIYEMILHLYNFIVASKEPPAAKLTALQYVKSLIETCQVPCINLLEVYFVPLAFDIANQRQNYKKGRKGYKFFIDEGYSYRLPNIEEIGIQFVALATEIVFVMSLIKTKRTLNNEQLQQQSPSVATFSKLKELKIPEIPQKISNLKYFDKVSVPNYNKRYLKNLAEFEAKSENYSRYFVLKMVNSLQTERNPLFSIKGKKEGLIDEDLDQRKILKSGDTYITSPLIQEIIDGIKMSENFIVKRNFLSLFSDFVKWADIQAVVGIIFDEIVDDIAMRVAEVEGHKGLEAGQKIYKQVRGQREAKKKFYIQFLKCLQLWNQLLRDNPFFQEGKSKLQQFYHYLKNDRNFVFPANIMANKIQEQFLKAVLFNQERNQKIVQRLKLDSNSSIHKSSIKQSIHEKLSSVRVQQAAKSKAFSVIKQQFDLCLKTLTSLCDNQQTIKDKIKLLLDFRESFDVDLENLEDIPNQDEFLEMLDDGDALISNINAMEVFYNDYKSNVISFEELTNLYEKRLQIIEQKAEADRSLQEHWHEMHQQSMVNLTEKNKEKNEEENPQTSNENSSLKLGTDIYSKNQPISEFSLPTPKKIESSQNSQPKQYTNDDHCESSSFQGLSSSQPQPIVSNTEYSQAMTAQLPFISSQNMSEEQPHFRKIKDSPTYAARIEHKSMSASGTDYYSIQNSQFPPNPHEYTFQKKQIEKYLNSPNNNLTSSYKTSKQQQFHSFTDDIYIKPNNQSPPINGNLILEGEYGMSRQASKSSHAQQTIEVNAHNILASENSQLERSSNQFLQKSQKSESNHINQSSKLSSKRSSRLKGSRHRQQIKINRSYSKKSLRSKNKEQKQKQSLTSSQYFDKESSKLNESQVSRSSSKKKKLQSSSTHRVDTMNMSTKQANHLKEYAINTIKPKKDQQNKRTDAFSKNTQKVTKQPKISSEYLQIYQKKDFEASTKEKFYFPHKTQESLPDAHKNPYNRNSPYYIESHEQLISYKQVPETVKSIEKMEINVESNLRKSETKELNSEKSDSFSKEKSFERKMSDKLPKKRNFEYLPSEEYMSIKDHKHFSKNKQIEEMQNKIQKLRKESSEIKKQLSMRTSFNRSRENSVGSNGFQEFSEARSRSNSSSFQSETRPRLSMKSLYEGRINKIKQVPYNKYSRYFEYYGDATFRKNMLKSKALITKVQGVELGFLSKMQKVNTIKISVYITPQVQLRQINHQLKFGSQLSIKSYPEKFDQIAKDKQVRISITIQVKSYPFDLPSIELSYLSNKKQNKNSMKFFLPISPHRFCQYYSVPLTQIPNLHEQSIITTRTFKINRKFFKTEKIKEFIPNLTIVNEYDNQIEYKSKCCFNHLEFMIKFIAKGNNFMQIKVILDETYVSQMRALSESIQFLLASLKALFCQQSQ